MPFNRKIIQNGVGDVIRTVLAMPDGSVRRANQDGSPAGNQGEDYATTQIITLSPDGRESRTVTNAANNQVTEALEGYRTFMLSINFYRPASNGVDTAFDRAVRLQTLIRSSLASTLLNAINVGVVSVGSPRDLTAVVDTFFEDRAQMDIEFSTITKETVTLDTFGTFPVTIKTSDSETNIIVQES